MVLASIVVVLLILIVIFGVYVVQQQTVVIIERLGKFHRIVSPGIHVRIPLIDVIAKRVDLRTSQAVFKIDAKTKDNVTVTMEIAAQYHVSAINGTSPQESGAYRSFYMLTNPVEQMTSYLIDALRSAIPNYDLDSVFAAKDSIASEANATVAEMMQGYGFDLVSTLITSIILPREVEASMNKINSAQREQVAAQSLAEAERIKVVTEAKASAEAMEQAGRGIAAQRKAIADGIADSLETIKQSGVSSAEANQLFLYTQWCDMMEKFARNGNQSTIVLPSDFRESASMFEQMLIANSAKDDLDGLTFEISE
ncbi:MAG: SPFH domain-containing protein [Coriobacteriia bacterium]|nr:SPFH domain-containing protein [Coriobacteriia bacterium]